jgi:hypothetical protein
MTVHTGLPLHRSYACILKEQPIVHLVELSRAGRVGDLVVLVILGDEILHYAAGFEQVDRAAIGECIG